MQKPTGKSGRMAVAPSRLQTEKFIPLRMIHPRMTDASGVNTN